MKINKTEITIIRVIIAIAIMKKQTTIAAVLIIRKKNQNSKNKTK